jgi:hypothetical protein
VASGEVATGALVETVDVGPAAVSLGPQPVTSAHIPTPVRRSNLWGSRPRNLAMGKLRWRNRCSFARAIASTPFRSMLTRSDGSLTTILCDPPFGRSGSDQGSDQH